MPCPLAGYRIDENGARIVAGIVSLGVVAGVLLPTFSATWVFAFLALDFALRAFSRPRWSPLGRLSGLVLKLVGAAPRLVDAGPKRFAARIGLVFTVALTALSASSQGVAVEVVGAILLVCALLESLLGLCLGCQLWTAWYRITDSLFGGRAERG